MSKIKNSGFPSTKSVGQIQKSLGVQKWDRRPLFACQLFSWYSCMSYSVAGCFIVG